MEAPKPTSTEDCQKIAYVQLSLAPSISMWRRCCRDSWVKYSGTPAAAEEKEGTWTSGAGAGVQGKIWTSVEAMKASIMDALSSVQRFIATA
ncbi:hypothetical protein IEQ34_014242 [Dendrobium chrysotoxum]|uniref:Uncharacterized protein n=1 Tax=Dendrobium chrysotoxum TaxID=161865 RepID=A0AAV7GKP6_DENCH|nr:hypothetical protein IEQ34_014242 [Dendrobium chrysotoxum]